MKTILSPCIFCFDEQQRPRRLPCAHSFCSDCLERYLQVRGDPRCPLCRREFQFQVSAGDPAEASNDSTTDPDPHVVPAAATIPDEHLQTTDQFLHLFDIDIDMLNDTLVLTLTEGEIRLFADLYEGVIRDDQRQTLESASDSTETWLVRDREFAYNYT
ncbi:hypothetical protein ACLKA6_005612 [Drosophila palustris]